MPDPSILLEMRHVTKRYGGTLALSDVSFAARAGEIHAVMGENGAGKSTLIRVSSGVTDPSDGELLYRGEPVRFTSPLQAMRQGIVCVFQELSLVPDLTVAENLSIVDGPRRFGLANRRAEIERARALLDSVGCGDIHPLELVRDLTLSRRQMVEIAKALGRKPRLLILDEATSALTSEDVERVFAIVRRLRDEGVGILYVSHRMQEIEALADTVSVFRNGRHIETFKAGSKPVGDIVQLMIGREVESYYPPKSTAPRGETALKVDALSWGRQLKGVDLELHKGEILGIGGLDGQGQRELLLALFGALKDVGGTVTAGGQRLRLSGPTEAMAAPLPIALIPEDRKFEGLMLPMSVKDNMSLAALKRFSGPFGIDAGAEAAEQQRCLKELQIKAPDLDAAVSTLSGGNQQKVVLAKWLMTAPGILLFSDPTRGIDVGTKQEIYRLLRRLADEGAAILFYSTDYAELIGCCDRVLVMYGGRVTRELAGDELTDRNLLEAALDVSPMRRSA